jgi:hypothetical protein
MEQVNHRGRGNLAYFSDLLLEHFQPLPRGQRIQKNFANKKGYSDKL